MPACGAVVENDPLRLNLNGQRKRLPLAVTERLAQNGLRQRQAHGFHSQPGRQVGTDGRFARHSWRNENRPKQRGEKMQLFDSSECDQRAGIQDDGH